MTIADQILSSRLLASGERFTAQHMAKHLGCSQSAVKFELRQLTEAEVLESRQDGVSKPTYYWRRNANLRFIYTRPLADTSWMEAGV